MGPVRRGRYDDGMIPPEPAPSNENGKQGDVTRLLARLGKGDSQAEEALIPLIYEQLRAVAVRRFKEQRRDHTLQPTALVHEAFVKLMGSDHDWESRAHFVSVASRAMRQVLQDHARAKSSAKRGADAQEVPLDQATINVDNNAIDLVDLNQALEKLSEMDSRQARVVELRFFGGLSAGEIARVLDVGERTVVRDWRHARAWLSRELA